MRSVDPARMRHYRDRTMTAPPAEFVITEDDEEASARYHEAFALALPLPALPPVLAWRDDVERYARARGKRVDWLFERGRPPHTVLGPGEVIRWRLI